MKNLLKTKAAAWGELVLIVIWLVWMVSRHMQWWYFISVFFAFMMAFCHLAALYLYKTSSSASKKLDLVALVMGVLFIVAIIVEAVFA